MSKKLTDKKALKIQLDRYNNFVENAPLCKCGCGKKVHVLEKVKYWCIASYKYPDFLTGHNVAKADRSLKPTKEMEQVILGGILGDTYLGFGHNRSESPRIAMNHSIKQKAYQDWKVRKLKPMVFSKGKLHKTSFNGIVQGVASLSYPFLIAYHKLGYTKKKNRYVKVASPLLLNKLDLLGLAVWYMDDGSVSTRKDANYVTIHSNAFTKLENDAISKFFFTKWGLENTVGYNKTRKCYYIRFNKNGSHKFLKMIKPFMCPSMRYKLGSIK